MATVIYGGSPRHHSRSHHLHNQTQSAAYMSQIIINPSNSLNHHHHSKQQQSIQPPPPTPSSVLSYNSHPSPILMPPVSYLSQGTPISTGAQQQQSQQQSHTHSTVHHPHAHPQSPPNYQQQAQHYHHPAALIYQANRNDTTIGGSRHHHKRRSAVEMLAESKPFYVKSETLLDRHQQHLNYSREKRNSSNRDSPIRTLNHHHHHHHHGIINRTSNRRSASSSSDLLQTKLRKLLNTDTKECPVPEIPRYKGNVIKKYDTFSKYQTVKYNQELSIHPSNESNVFPSAFLSPQSLPPASDDDIYSYGIDEPLILTDDYRAISPPAEYAAVDDNSPDKEQRCNYQRSYSHSHEVTSDDPDYSSPSYNINSHKSLPDLHSQISRHSPHSEILSCCSRGNRSNKSGGGSSLNRDSGGSSGHYTHRSEPCCKQQQLQQQQQQHLQQQQQQHQLQQQQREIGNNKLYVDYRRDSGSSTQHSGNSYYAYGMAVSPSSRYDCPECRAQSSKYYQQQQYQQQKESECLLNFTTPEVPEAFQDNYEPRYYDEKSSRKFYNKMNHQNSPTTVRTPDSSCGGICIKEQELSPPLGTFKRQKCFRFKQRTRYSSNDRSSCRTEQLARGDPTCDNPSSEDDRKPILRSKSDISDRYWSRVGGATLNIVEHNSKSASGGLLEKRSRSESLTQLEKFFDRLGLNEEKFEEIYSPNKKKFGSHENDSDQSSTVFFSDVSTVDSTRLPDSTETQTQTQPYRPTEPPSIVERNARIIKWLCNCRKLALT